jgi:deoxyribodipyrimidine photo-lyase
MNETIQSNISIFWFRRDLRLEDNTGLNRALEAGRPVLTIFIFDEEILRELPADDPRVTFIYEILSKMDLQLKKLGSSLKIYKGSPKQIWMEILDEYDIEAVFTNRDYEPYAISRDESVEDLLAQKGVAFKTFKDQVIFEGNEVLKDDGNPYHVFTPYKNKWLRKFSESGFKVGEVPTHIESIPVDRAQFIQQTFHFPSMEVLGLKEASVKVRPFELSVAGSYNKNRDYPAIEGTSHLGPHLRFGTVSIRKIIQALDASHEVFLSELIWREFFMQILHHYPRVVNENFKKKYDGIVWRNNEEEFEKWCRGETGYALVDAGMRELNATGHMHNRVRMITAGFLCKHLLIDWRWGEGYFASKLLDYELSSNNGNWQWSAGTGCDAAPYFRIFNPMEQLKKFDKEKIYVKKWISELGTGDYPEPMVDHKMARARALETYKRGME